MNIRKLGIIAGILGVVVLLQACGYFYGGGWALSMYGDNGEKVTFGIEGGCQDDVDGFAVLDLDLTFHDHGYDKTLVYNQNANNKKHFAIFSENLAGFVDDLPYSCAELALIWDVIVEPIIGDIELPPELEGVFDEGGFVWGYCPQGASNEDGTNLDCGTMISVVEDTGNTGPDKGDQITLVLAGGHYDGYYFSGFLEGGNLTVEIIDPIPAP